MDYNRLSYKYELLINNTIANYVKAGSENLKNKRILLDTLSQTISVNENLSIEHVKMVFLPYIDELINSYKNKINEKEKDLANIVLSKYASYFEKFNEITYRKVIFIDEYWDENHEQLDLEIKKFLLKIQSKEKAIFSKLLIIELTNRLKDEFYKYYNKQDNSSYDFNLDINHLSGIEFEQEIMSKLIWKWYVVQWTPRTGDQWADIIAQKEWRKYIIQAKRYSWNVWNWAIQEVIAALTYYGWDEWWVVTNSLFTNSAIALAQKWNIKLIDKYSLTDIW
jgi:HJR/Mrr/RecB family endonuclease